jgi:hypothetical protein
MSDLKPQDHPDFIGGWVWTELEMRWIEDCIAKAIEKEREALEQELLKLKKGIAANSDYIQGRWDLIGEFQDIIRARGKP